MASLAAFVTDFADQAVLLPLAGFVALVFALAGWWRGALAWCAAVGVTFALLLGLKFVFLACGDLVTGGAIHSPSGHTAAGGVVYGGLLALVLRRRTGNAGWSIPASIVVAGVFGATRLLLGVHSLAEVVVAEGVAVGGVSALVALAGPPPAARTMGPAGVVVVLAMVALHGQHMPAEAVIRRFAYGAWLFAACR